MLLLISVLPNDYMHNCFQDIFFWYYTLHVFDQVVCFVYIIVLEIIDYQVESSFVDNIYQGRQHLKSILTTSKNN